MKRLLKSEAARIIAALVLFISALIIEQTAVKPFSLIFYLLALCVAGYTVFIEVKTRSGDEFGAPSEAVNRKKQEKYFKVASEYLMRKDKTDTPCRFDVVEIENGQINLIFDAFCM